MTCHPDARTATRTITLCRLSMFRDLAGHTYVRQDQVDIDFSCEKFESVVGALRLDDLEASTVKLISQIEPKEQFIFNHHDGVFRMLFSAV